MASDVAADEPPAAPTVQELCAVDKPPTIPTVQKLCPGDVHPDIPNVEELGTGDAHRAIPTIQELGAGDAHRVIPTIQELGTGDSHPADLCAADTGQEQEDLSRFTNYPNPLDFNNDTSHHYSDNNNILEEQIFQGDVSEVEGINVDITETDASDGILFDGLRTMLQKILHRKQRRNVLKEQSSKRSRAQMGTSKECLNKGRAAAYSRFSMGYFAKIVDSVCKSNYKMELVKNTGFGYLLEVDDCYVPRPFAQWVADNISTTHEAIVLRGKSIPLNAEAVSLVLGIPAGITPINTMDEENGKAEFFLPWLV